MDESHNATPIRYEQLTSEQQRERWEQAGQTALKVATVLQRAAERGYPRTPELDLLADGMMAMSADEGVAVFIGEKATLETRIDDIVDMSVNLYNRLKRRGINTIGDLLTLSYKDLLSIRGLGPRGVAELRSILEPLGITLRDK